MKKAVVTRKRKTVAGAVVRRKTAPRTPTTIMAEKPEKPAAEARPSLRGESSIAKPAVIAELTKSSHGDLKTYLPTGRRAAKEDPEFLAHLIAWNEKHGQIRDSKVALPVAGLAEPGFPQEYVGNSLAHIALLDPRNLVRAVKFAREAGIGKAQRGSQLSRLVEGYLRAREGVWSWWERSALQHRESMKTLYAMGHTKPSAMADLVLFKREYPKGTIFETVRQLKTMSPREAAGTILEKRIPFLIAKGALGEKAKESDLVLALIDGMSATELVTNTKMLEGWGMNENPALRAAYKEGLEKKVATSTKTSLKATRAAGAVGDKKLQKQLRGAQEKQIEALGGIEGDWLVLGDKSGSMEWAIEMARGVAGILAKMVKGKVTLVFFDTHPRAFEVTGMTYEEILRITRGMLAGGGTSIGCGLALAYERGTSFDGIAIVSDGEENNFPQFAVVYDQGVKRTGVQVPVYFYKVAAGHQSVFYGVRETLTPSMRTLGYDLIQFDLKGVDYYSLPNLVKTMRVSRYSLVDEILGTPLLTVEEALKPRKRFEESVN